MYGRHFVYERYDVAQEFHQATYAHVLACTYAEYGEHAAGGKTFADTFAHFVLGEGIGFEEFFHQSFIVFCGSFHESLVPSCGLFHLFFGDRLNGGRTAFGSPRVFLHQQHVDEGVEVRTGVEGVLYGYNLGAVDAFELLQQVVIVAFVAVQLVDQEDDRLAQLFGVAEVVLCAHFDAILSVEQEDSRVCNIQGGDCRAYKVVATRAVDDIEFLSVPLHMVYSGEYRIAILLLHGEVVADCIFGSDSAAAFYDTTLIEQSFCESGFSCTVIAQEGNVFNFMGLINFHDIIYNIMCEYLTCLRTSLTLAGRKLEIIRQMCKYVQDVTKLCCATPFV